MSDKLLSVKETREQLKRKISPFVWDEKDAYGFDIFIDTLISAVRREQDLIATKRERKRAAIERKTLEAITKLAITSVKYYHYADSENDKWRERHKDWKELEKIITDKEHLEVEALYDKASEMMEETISLYAQYQKKILEEK